MLLDNVNFLNLLKYYPFPVGIGEKDIIRVHTYPLLLAVSY